MKDRIKQLHATRVIRIGNFSFRLLKDNNIKKGISMWMVSAVEFTNESLFAQQFFLQNLQ
jgi:hypothetical protein